MSLDSLLTYWRVWSLDNGVLWHTESDMVDPIIEKLKASRRTSIASIKSSLKESERAAGETPNLKVRGIIERANKAKKARLAVLEAELKDLEACQPDLPGVSGRK